VTRVGKSRKKLKRLCQKRPMPGVNISGEGSSGRKRSGAQKWKKRKGKFPFLQGSIKIKEKGSPVDVQFERRVVRQCSLSLLGGRSPKIVARS